MRFSKFILRAFASREKKRMNCVVCCERMRASIECRRCAFVCCKTCQRTHFQIEKTLTCLQCKQPFDRAEAVRHKMYDEWKAVEEIRLLEEQTKLLPDTQPLVEWEREYRRQHARLRFGERMTIRERPQLQESVQAFFACPKEGCRGFVDEHSDTCGSCREQVCRLCRELKPHGHVCNSDVLQSISLLQRDSRPCPKCAALIFKIAGCNHMHCTHCNTHFDWNSGEVLTQSTNGHYRDSVHARAGTVTTRASPSASAGGGGAEDCTSQDEEYVRRHFVRMPDSIVRRTLWDDYSVVRYTMEKYYNANVIGTRRDNTLMNLRIQYLMNEITPERFRSSIFAAHKLFECSQAIAFQFGLYVEYMQHYQRLNVESAAIWNPDEIESVIRQINTHLHDLARQFLQTTTIRIRIPSDSSDVPALIR